MKRLLGVAALVLVAGCGGSDGDSNSKAPSPLNEADGRALLAKFDISPPDWNHYVDVVQRGICDNKADEMPLYVANLLDMGSDIGTPAETRASIEVVCPGRLADWDAAVRQVDETSGRVDRICATPEDLFESLSEEDMLTAVAVCDEFSDPRFENLYDQKYPTD